MKNKIYSIDYIEQIAHTYNVKNGVGDSVRDLSFAWTDRSTYSSFQEMVKSVKENLLPYDKIDDYVFVDGKSFSFNAELTLNESKEWVGAKKRQRKDLYLVDFFVGFKVHEETGLTDEDFVGLNVDHA